MWAGSSLVEAIRDCAQRALQVLCQARRPSAYLRRASVLIATKLVLANNTLVNELELLSSLSDDLAQSSPDLPYALLEAAVMDAFDFRACGVRGLRGRLEPERLRQLDIRCAARSSLPPRLLRSHSILLPPRGNLEALAHEEVHARFAVVRRLGQGAHGIVWRVQSGGTPLAMKRIEVGADGLTLNTIREVNLLRAHADDHIVALVDVLYYPPYLYLLMPLLGDLLRYDREVTGTPQACYHARFLTSATKQLFEALAFLRAHDTLHRDIKPENILVDRVAGLLKLSDFGHARYAAPGPMTTEVATLWYRAPELLLGYEAYDASVDVWSLACVLVELASGAPWLAASSEVGQLRAIFTVLGPPTSALLRRLAAGMDLSMFARQDELFRFADGSTMTRTQRRQFTSLIERMVRYNRHRRLTPEKALALPIVRNAADTF